MGLPWWNIAGINNPFGSKVSYFDLTSAKSLFVLVVLLIIATFPGLPDHYREAHWYGMLSILGLSACYVVNRFGWIVGGAFAVVSYLGLLKFLFPYSPFLSYGYVNTKVLKSMIASSFVYWLGFVALFCLLPTKWREHVTFGILALGIVDSLWVFWNLGMGSYPSGLFRHSTLDACFLASLIPCYLFRYSSPYRLLFSALAACAVGVIGSTTAVLALGVGIAAYFLSVRPLSALIGSAIASSSLILFSSYLLPANDGHDFNGRLGIWKLTWNHFWQSDFIWTGFGMGSFEAWGPALQKASNENLEYGLFIWAHNEWLQVLFEGGMIGFLTVFGLYIYGLVKSYRVPWLFSSWAVIGFIALTQPPLRVFIYGLWVCVLARTIFVEREEYLKTQWTRQLSR